MVASKGYADVGAFLDFTHLTHLAEPPVETNKSCGEWLYSHWWGNLPSPKKRIQKAQVKHSPAWNLASFSLLLLRKLDLEGPMFVCHDQKPSTQLRCVAPPIHPERSHRQQSSHQDDSDATAHALPMLPVQQTQLETKQISVHLELLNCHRQNFGNPR